MEQFELAILFTTAGALVGAALVKSLVSAAKSFGLPSTGRAPMLAALTLSAGLIGLALWGSDMLADGLDPEDVLVVILSWLGLYTASVGVHETAVKVERIATGTTNPSGPDNGS
jgi:hypothetical protein